MIASDAREKHAREMVMDNISVGFVISTLNRAGAESKLVAVANGLDREKYSARVFVLKTGPLVESVRVPCWDNIIPSKYSLPGFFRLFRLIKRSKLDILWVVGTGDAGFFGRIAARLAGVPNVVLSFHATTRPGGQPTIDRVNKILNRFRPFTSRFVAVAEDHMNHLVENEDIDPSRITFIHNGVDLNTFRPSVSPSETDFDIPSDAPVMGIVARFKPEKRHDLFLEAAKLLMNRHPGLWLLMVGDGPLMEQTRNMAKEMGILDRTVFTGGLDDVLPALNRMTVSVLCSDMEAFPNAVLESMAAGVPVVATDVGSVHEAITDGVNGVLIPRGNAQELFEAVDRILKDESLRECIVANALSTVRSKFSLKGMISAREALFEELMAADSHGEEEH